MVDSFVNTDYTGLVRLVNLNLLQPQMLVSLFPIRLTNLLHIRFVSSKVPSIREPSGRKNVGSGGDW